MLYSAPGLALVTVFQDNPFHDLIRAGPNSGLLFTYEPPAATHDREERHDTALRKSKYLGGPGLLTIDQAEPFQDSISVRLGMEPSPSLPNHPTAAQKLRDVHDTPSSALNFPPGCGLGTTVQAEPCDDSIRV